MCLSHQVEVQLLWVLDVVVDVVHVEVHQLLQLRQDTSSWLLCSVVPLHLVDVDLLDECVCGTLALLN